MIKEWHSTDELPSEADLKKLEKRIDYQLPSDFRQTLLEHNGGQPEPGNLPDAPYFNQLAGVTGKDSLFLSIFDRYDKYFRKYKLLTIGVDPGGSFFALNFQNEPPSVVYIDFDVVSEYCSGSEEYPELTFKTVADSWSELLEKFTDEDE